MNQLETPVLLLMFNRPVYTRRVFDAIRAARPKKLYISCDGPRTEAERALVEETRAITEEIDWPCEVQRQYAEQNRSLRYGPPAGINWMFEYEERGIILEDDCLPHSDFFRFASELLEKYRDDDRVVMISGDNFIPDVPVPQSYLFSRYFPIWGWATWKRSWDRYDPDILDWPHRKKTGWLNTIYQESYMRAHFSALFEGIVAGSLNTWDVQWAYACLASGGFCAIPKKNLVSNIGVIGTHSASSTQNQETAGIYDLNVLSHPQKVEEASAYDTILYDRLFRPRGTWYTRIKALTISILVRSIILKKIYRFFV